MMIFGCLQCLYFVASPITYCKRTIVCIQLSLLTVVGVETMPAFNLLFWVSLALFDDGRNVPKKNIRGILSKKTYETTMTKRLQANKLLHFSLVVQ